MRLSCGWLQDGSDSDNLDCKCPSLEGSGFAGFFWVSEGEQGRVVRIDLLSLGRPGKRVRRRSIIAPNARLLREQQPRHRIGAVHLCPRVQRQLRTGALGDWIPESMTGVNRHGIDSRVAGAHCQLYQRVTIFSRHDLPLERAAGYFSLQHQTGRARPTIVTVEQCREHSRDRLSVILLIFSITPNGFSGSTATRPAPQISMLRAPLAGGARTRQSARRVARAEVVVRRCPGGETSRQKPDAPAVDPQVRAISR